MRRNLVDACRRQGLAVVGYSGRDASIMAALTEALDEGRGFPGGLFWFKRSQIEPYDAATQLIRSARALGIDAHIVEAESFDELFSDLVRYLPKTADKVQTSTVAAPAFGQAAPRTKRRRDPGYSNECPANRFSTCALSARGLPDRRIRGNQEAIAAAGVDIDAQRMSDGVAFGRDADVRKVFEPFVIKAFDTHPLASRRLVNEPGERALLRHALFRALGKRPGLRLQQRGRKTALLPDAATVNASIFNADRIKPVDRLSGVVPKTAIGWSEACGLRVDYRLDRLWLLLDPIIITDIPEETSEEQVEVAREFVRARRAGRHNKAANAMLDGWVRLILGQEANVRLRAFDIGDGIDAEFEVLRTSGFSGAARR